MSESDKIRLDAATLRWAAAFVDRCYTQRSAADLAEEIRNVLMLRAMEAEARADERARKILDRWSETLAELARAEAAEVTP